MPRCDARPRAQDLLCSAPGNPLIRAALEATLAMRANPAGHRCGSIPCDASRHALVVATGARAFLWSVSEGIFGRRIPALPGPAISTAVRKLLLATWPLVITTVEQLPLGPSMTLSHRVQDGALSPNSPAIDAFTAAKERFYREAGLSHWTETIRADARWTEAGF